MKFTTATAIKGFLLAALLLGGPSLALAQSDHELDMPASPPTGAAPEGGPGLEHAGAIKPAEITTTNSDAYGTYLTDGKKRPLYLFKADKKGDGDARSRCHDDCALDWPPHLTKGEPVASGEARKDMLGTMERENGAKQVTYNGWPLYLYVGDIGPGEGVGQDKAEYGAEWYLVAPDGSPIEKHARKGS